MAYGNIREDDINASWFKNLNIDPFLMDLPGLGNNRSFWTYRKMG